MTMIDIKALLDRIPHETARSLVEISKLRTPGLEAEILTNLTQRGREMILEGAFPWRSAEHGWEAARAILQTRTLDLLSASPPPYAHQVEAWRHLRARDPRSLIVSSGTGSGKTECFLTPILDRLVELSGGGERRLTGVRAIMLYPLNALINSQEERLSEWLGHFGGALRYCLYNGATPYQAEAREARAKPERVLDRETLRQSPPPVLVTNVTMLEYMLVRKEDAPILQKSNGTLEYIVLDEAHTYIGAQAAELSLLLRRVAAAFGKRPEELRYVATSATIGNNDPKPLGDFLADLSGAPREQVHVVLGERAPLPETPTDTRPLSLQMLDDAAPEECSRLLFANATLARLRRQLNQDQPLTWSQWESATREILADEGAGRSHAVDLLLHCLQAARTGENGVKERLLPVRLHMFHPVLSGVSVCAHPGCSGKPLGVENWPYGAISTERHEHCSHCGSVMFEWVSCRTCGDGALLARDDGRRLTRPAGSSSADNFLQDLDPEFDEADLAEDAPQDASGSEAEGWDDDASGTACLLTADQNGVLIHVNPRSGEILDIAEPDALSLRRHDDPDTCPHCRAAPEAHEAIGPVRPLRAGAPFLVRQIIPALLPMLSASEQGEGLPAGGRKLITFTDARQGTAKHAGALQIGAEREFVRAWLYHAVQVRNAVDEGELSSLRNKIAKLERWLKDDPDPDMADMLEPLRAELAEAESGGGARLVSDLIGELANHSDVRGSLLDLWSERSSKLAKASDVAEFLLLRELARRPKWAASAETLGLIRLTLPGRIEPPDAAKHLGLTQPEWKAFLELILTHYLRQNQMLWVREPAWMPFAGIQGGGRLVVRSTEEIEDKKRQKLWPTPYSPGAARTGLISMLAQAVGRDLDDRQAMENLDDLFGAAFNAFNRAGVLKSEAQGFRLDWTKLAIEPVREAEICSVTRLPLQAGLRGLSIYKGPDGRHPKTDTARFPEFPFANKRRRDGSAVSASDITDWLESDPDIQDLRARRLWDGRTDRAARFDPYFRTAEHSAQLDQPTLQRYEQRFKEGRLNVLSCSTTMEMGVDIGLIEAVLLTNAPPSIANYKQRVGRAGRRGQPISLGLTICKDRPLDQEVANDPEAFFLRKQSAPRVSLDSAMIVQRHVNAWLLARYLRDVDAELQKLTVGEFFALVAEEETESPAASFAAWLDANAETLGHERDLDAILFGTPLAPGAALALEARNVILDVQQSIHWEWEALQGAEEGAGAAGRARSAQRDRIAKDYLLSALSGQGFLPAYGFPTGVVTFWPYSRADLDLERRRREADGAPLEDRRFKARGLPSRQRNLAIFEYAPGAEVTVDGIVRRSAGITLNWRRPASEDQVREVQSLRTVLRCPRCGRLRSMPSAGVDRGCANPGCAFADSERINYLAPAGFSVDRLDEATDQSRGYEYSPRPNAWVGALKADWRDLPDPELGRLRTDPAGMVFAFNPGPTGQHGYALCLECGRAEPETEADGPVPTRMENHKPLRKLPDTEAGDVCPGAVKSFKVQRNLYLGEETRTSVFELQLSGLNSRGAALAAALALREANARNLGVEPSEMGAAAVETRGRDGQRAHTAVVYDLAAGGAGFASAIGDDLETIIQEAVRVLDCRAPGKCGDPDTKRICSACVLSSDVQHLEEEADRKGAFQALSNAALRLALPEPFKIFGSATRYESAPLLEAATRFVRGRSDAGLMLRLEGDPASWDFEEWPATGLLKRFTATQGQVALVVDADDLETSKQQVKADFALNAERIGARVFDRADLDWPAGAAVVARSGNETRRWGARGAHCAAGPHWGLADGAPNVWAKGGPDVSADGALDTLSWLNPKQGASLRVITTQLDGPTAQFGERFKALAGELAPDVFGPDAPKAKVIRIQDRYIYNPLSVLLYRAIMGALAGPGCRCEIETRGTKRHEDFRLARRLTDDWADIEDRDRVLQGLFATIGAPATIRFPQSTAHWRTIAVETETGGQATLVLDQGVGAWRPSLARPFDFDAPVARQIEKLDRENIVVTCQGGKTYIGLIE